MAIFGLSLASQLVKSRFRSQIISSNGDIPSYLWEIGQIFVTKNSNLVPIFVPKNGISCYLVINSS